MAIQKDKKKAILILGAPGSGKGTQGKVLGALPHFFHCACGDVFRSLDTSSKLGKEFLEYSNKGMLVPDELTIELWEAQIDIWAASNVYFPETDMLILDGIPRNVEQAKILEDYIDVKQVFHLSCPDRNELARRMQSRAIKENRMDDANAEVVEKRIQTYEMETKPILEFYSEGIRTNIDASQAPSIVLHDILTKLIALDIH